MSHDRLGGPFRGRSRAAAASRPSLRSVFGAFIPLFVRWSTMLRGAVPTSNDTVLPLLSELQHLLRPDVAYLTASFDDTGLGTLGALLPNLVILGMGGYAHVPIPEFNPFDGHDPLDRHDAAALQAAAPPFSSRPMLFSFLGSSHSLRKNGGDPGPIPVFRQAVCDVAAAAATTPPRVNYTLCTSSPDFKQYRANSTVTLSPRGYGRQSLRLGETIRSHNLPVAVYDDIDFVPYAELWPTFAWSASLDGLPALIGTLKTTREDDFQRRLAALRRLLPTHFTIQGVAEQMRLFARGGGDLRCQRMPACPQTDCVYRRGATADGNTTIDCASARATATGLPPVLPTRLTDDCTGKFPWVHY